MALFNFRKRKTSRTLALRSDSSLLGRWEAIVRNRALIVRLAICVFAVIALVAAVEGWRSAFPYRLGDVIDHGIVAKTDFGRVNHRETERLLEETRRRVPPVFLHDPTLVNALMDKFRSGLVDVAQAETIDDLRPETRAAFGLTRAETAGERPPDQGDMQTEFGALKQALTDNDGVVGSKIDNLVVEFSRFINPIRQVGVIDPNDPQRVRLNNPDQPIGVITSQDDVDIRIIPQADVKLTSLMSPSGLLGKSWQQQRFPELVTIRVPLERWLLSQTPVTLRYNSEASKSELDKQLAAVEPVIIRFSHGDRLIGPGEAIDEEALAILSAEHEQLAKSIRLNQRVARLATVFALISVLAILCGYYLVHGERQLVQSTARLSVYLTVTVGAIVLARVLSYDPWRAEVIPLLAATMILAIAYNQELAAMTGLVLTLVIVLSTTRDLGHFVVLMTVATAAVVPLSSIPARSKLIKVGFWTACVYFLVSLGTSIVQRPTFTDAITDVDVLMRCSRGAAWCLAAGYLVAGSLPFIESTFGVVTDISLLEMSDVSHPLLQQLVARAPGTYNHSITVAAIGEAAADKIGANGLLVRVGAYFHDVGKMLKPHYFVENMTEGADSRHAHLAPAMSTLIIIGHVKDGVDLAHQHNLPKSLIDFIEQHHGTTLVEYFYHEAARLADQQPDHKTEVEEFAFRYPGPKPQTREAGVLMIADAVESASRTLSEPTPKRIETLVHEIAMKRLLDGQFEECSLTLSEIHAVEESLIKSLIGIYHGRIKYPEQKTA